jgi:hypothetical protein
MSSTNDVRLVVGVTRDGLSRSWHGALGEFEFADAAVGERELVAQLGDLLAQPLVVVECGAESGAHRLVARLLPGRRRLGFAAQALDLCA